MERDYRLMTRAAFLAAAEKNPYNHGEEKRILYGSFNPEYGYFGTKNSDRINDYLRKRLKTPDPRWLTEAGKTIALLHKAANAEALSEDVTLFRLFRLSYLEEGMELSEQAKRIKEKCGTVFREMGFTSTGIRVDQNPDIFNPERPYLMVIKARAGTKAFVTANAREGEILFDAGLSIYVEEAEDHLTDPLNVPLSDYEEKNEQTTARFFGIVMYGTITGGA